MDEIISTEELRSWDLQVRSVGTLKLFGKKNQFNTEPRLFPTKSGTILQLIRRIGGI